VETIGGAQYLIPEDPDGTVHFVQFKTVDGIDFSVNFFGPPAPGAIGPSRVSHQFAVEIVQHLG
jgi:hypothetical protein